MTINIRPKHIVITIAIVSTLVIGYVFKDFIFGLFVSGPQKSVDTALKYFNSQGSENPISGDDPFDTDFYVKLLLNRFYYKVTEWKLVDKGEKNGKHFIMVNGTATNGFGVKLERYPVFVVEKVGSSWKITDSYDFFAFDKINDMYSYGKSDLEKNKIMDELKDKILIEKWSFESSYGNSIQGVGIIVNNSEIPVSYIKLRITYYDRKDNVSNSDETYAISDELLPGQKRSFEWFTSNCHQCNKATIKLIFD